MPGQPKDAPPGPEPPPLLGAPEVQKGLVRGLPLWGKASRATTGQARPGQAVPGAANRKAPDPLGLLQRDPNSPSLGTTPTIPSFGLPRTPQRQRWRPREDWDALWQAR